MSCTRPASGRCGARRRILLLLLFGLLIPVVATQPLLAQTDVPEHAIAAHPYAVQVAEASQRFGIPTAWIMAVMRAESAGDLRAVSSAGAMGLTQVMPDTWAGLRIRHGLGRDPFEPRDNILAGTAYLREMWDRYGNVAAMLAAYNAGPDRYDEYLATGRQLPAETRAYVDLLAPALGATVPSPGAPAAPSPPPDWREAPLFVPRSVDHRTVADSATDKNSDGTSAFVPVQSNAGDQSHPEAIFIAEDDTGGER